MSLAELLRAMRVKKTVLQIWNVGAKFHELDSPCPSQAESKYLNILLLYFISEVEENCTVMRSQSHALGQYWNYDEMPGIFSF